MPLKEFGKDSILLALCYGGVVVIDYRFVFNDGKVFPFRVDLDRHRESGANKGAFWTDLSFNQCPNCPLSTAKHNSCPPALDLEEIIRTFQDLMSYETVTIEVVTPERTISKRCDIQTGLRSLLGLIMATSGCPVLSQLRGLALSHLPFATMEETVIRTAGAYLLKQYFTHKKGGVPDLDLQGLEQLFKTLQTVDGCFKRRIDAASKQDANMNAVGSLAFLAMGVTFSVEDMLQELVAYAIPTEMAAEQEPLLKE